MSRPSTGKPELARVPEEPLPKPYHAEKLTPEKYYKLNEAVLIETGMTGIPHRPAPPPPSYRVQIAPTPGTAPPRPSGPEGPTFFGRKGPGAKLLLGIVGVLFFVTAGLAAGLGVSQRDLKQTRTALQAARVSATSAAPDAEPTEPTSPPVTPDNIHCPWINGTLHIVTNATITKTAPPDRLKFKLLCGVDFAGPAEATDLGMVKVQTLAECADACAGTANCTGAGWGAIPGDVGGEGHWCWMKTALVKGHVAAPMWGFAVLAKDGTVRSA